MNNNKFSLYTIEYNATHIEAFKKIEENKKCFLVVEKNSKVVGTFTDGDVRRAFLKGISPNDSIELTYNKNFEYLSYKDNVKDGVEKFRKKNIYFLLVLDENFRLVNIITKDNLHWLLLQDKLVSINYDFLSIDDSWISREIYFRPWGFYKTVVINDFFQTKIINLNPKSSLSLQKHLKREEYWTIVHGTGILQIGNSTKIVSAGDTVFIPKNCLHRLTNTSDSIHMIITEVQLGDYFGEDDIIRVQDEYGRN